MNYLTSLQLMSIIGHINLFSPFENTHLIILFGLKKYSNPWELYSLITHSHGECGWKFPCNLMAWRLLINLRGYMCMTHPLNIPYMVENGHMKVKDGHLTLLACLPHSPQSGLKFGWRNIKSISVYLASYIFQIYLKMKWNKCMETEGNSVFFGHR